MWIAARRFCALSLCAAVAGLPARPVFAGPSGEVVVEGTAEFSRPDDHTTIIDTSTDKTIVEYDSFDILQDELVQINQPTSDSKIINHVPFGDPTEIGGRLESNGYVYIVNPSGVFIGDQAVIDVGGLVAAAGRISYDEFLAGKDHFMDLGGEVVVAEGAVVQADETVALLGQRVANYGTIISRGGMVAIVAGDEAVLTSLHGRMMVRVDGGDAAAAGATDRFALTQAGEIDAGGGRVLLSAGDTYSLAMNHTGITRGGDIELHAQGEGLVQVAGTLDASNTDAGETGGSIEVTGDKIAVLDATLDASGDAGGGEIRVGGDVQGGGSLPTASRTFVSQDAELVADAITQGDGGSVVVWSEEKTGFYGSASARGGAQGGNGGFVEISGRQSLDARGHHVDVSAPFGENGTLLYDPARIEIIGGAFDGDDADPDAGSLDQAMGDILAGEANTIDPFRVYESEIESTDANIILQATTQIFTSGTFDNLANGSGLNEVFLLPGNSLVIQTTGAGPGPGEYAIDLAPSGLEDLTWKVSEGGVIDIRTNTGDPTNAADSTRADIRVGHLVFESREFVFDEDLGLSIPQLVSLDDQLTQLGIPQPSELEDRAVTVETTVGHIVIGSITADGTDAGAVPGGSGGTQLVSLIGGPSAGNVFVRADSGDVEVDGVSARGGSADALNPSFGGAGGVVTVETGDGNVTVGSIDVSGGDGQAGIVLTPGLPDGLSRTGDGGSGGQINLTAAGEGDTAPVVKVTGDLLADGGTGNGLAATLGGGQLSGIGGPSGRISIESEAGIEIGEAGSPIVISASGGDGIAGGGGASSGESTQAIRIVANLAPPEPDMPADILLEDVDFLASGGSVVGDGPGGAGGRAGNVVLDAIGGAIQGSGATITANGGDGKAPTFDPDAGAPITSGGQPRSILLFGDAGVDIGAIESRGGDAELGVDGVGAGGAGGGVEITAAAGGDIHVASIDVSGGNATTSDDRVAVAGAGGSITLDTRSDPSGPVVQGGNVLIGGALVSVGGVGEDEDETAVSASGGRVALLSNDAILQEAGGSVQGGDIVLLATQIGEDGTPIDIRGTDADDDTAVLQALSIIDEVDPNDPMAPLDPPIYGEIDANLLAGHGLERLTVVHGHERETSTVTEGGITTILQVDAAPMDGENAVLSTMATADAGPELHFELDTDPTNAGLTGDEPGLTILTDAVHLGDQGGSIVNDDGAIEAEAGATGLESHVESTGNVLVAGTTIGESGRELRVDGDGDASLQLNALGDIHVDVVDAEGQGAFGAVQVVQNLVTGETTLRAFDDMNGFIEGVTVEDLSPIDPDTMTVLDPLLLLSGDWSSDLVYRHSAGAPSGGGAPVLEVQDLEIGGSAVIEATAGDLHLAGNAVPSIRLTTAGSDLLLQASGDIIADETSDLHVELAGGGADLVIRAGRDLRSGDIFTGATGSGLVGGENGEFLETSNVDRMAAEFGSSLRVHNDGSMGSGLEIAQIQVAAPADRTGETAEAIVSGISGNGDLELDNDGTRIVLGEIPTNASGPPTHVSVAGDAVFHSPVEIENAQYISVLSAGDGDSADDLETELVAVNGARIQSGGDVVFHGSIDTGAGSTAVDDTTDPMEDTPEPDVFVAASLVVDAQGSAVYAGDVGVSGSAASDLDPDTRSALALFDTTDAVVSGDGETRQIHAGETVFRGTLDADAIDAVAASALIVGDPDALTDDAVGTAVTFGGNVGLGRAVTGLDVEADAIRFALAGGGSAEVVNVGGGGIDLSTDQAGVPSVATITDTSGNLRFQTSGDFTLGANDKMTVLGNLDIVSGGTVTVGDLNAARILVDSQAIQVRTRAPGMVELPDGSFTMDQGVDWVANDIRATSALTATPGGPIYLYLGSGGVSIPGGLGAYQVSYANAKQDAIRPGAIFGPDGVVLDLTGNGPGVVGDPTRVQPRYVEPSLVERLPQFDGDGPAPGSQVDARQVLAFLRCSGLGPDAPGCGPGAAAVLAGVDRFEESVLATDRAEDVTAHYRRLLAEPEAMERLRRAFADAGRAYGGSVEWRDGTLDGAEFYRFLATAQGETAEALASVRELAWLFAEIELMGLADEDTRRLQSMLAQEFADAAGLQGFDAQAVTAAVDASPVGLP